MRVKELTIHLWAKRDGFRAHVRQGFAWGTDLFERMIVRPQNMAEAQIAARCVIAGMGLDVEHIQFTTPPHGR